MCGTLRGLRREPPPPPQPRFGASAGGAGSRRSPPPGRQHYRSVRSRMPVLSAIIFDALLRASDPKMPAAPSAVHNGLVGGSSPPSPTTQSHPNRVFPVVLRGRRAGLQSLQGRSTAHAVADIVLDGERQAALRRRGTALPRSDYGDRFYFDQEFG